ncbi:MAG: hypothetical protein GY864_00070 [Desulfobacterales bacterium]|nr:hypothetical protein [Desulfobacterales bacterium]
MRHVMVSLLQQDRVFDPVIGRIRRIIMSQEKNGHYRKKHSLDRKVNEKISDILKEQAENGEISCIAAHKIATDQGSSPEEVGFTTDFHEIRIAECRLGLFGYKPDKKTVQPARSISEDLEKAILNGLINERLSCKAAWELAEKMDIKKIDVSRACEGMGVKISSCQLGAF